MATIQQKKISELDSLADNAMTNEDLLLISNKSGNTYVTKNASLSALINRTITSISQLNELTADIQDANTFLTFDANSSNEAKLVNMSMMVDKVMNANATWKTAVANFLEQFEELLPHIAFVDPDHSAKDLQDVALDAVDVLRDGSISLTYYDIIKHLNNCSLSRSTNKIRSGKNYETIVTPDVGYALSNSLISITMDGVDIKDQVWLSSTHTISVENVTGEIDIEISAIQKVLQSIDATYYQNGKTIFPSTALNDVATPPAVLSVVANYNDNTSETITNYTLNGTLAEGTSNLTVSYEGMTDTFDIVVSQPAVERTLTSITASYIQNGLEIDTDKTASYVTTSPASLTVTAHYSDNSSETISSGYALSGNLSTAGSCTITVTYQGMTTTFDVTVVQAQEPIVDQPLTVQYDNTTMYDYNAPDDLRPHLTVTYTDNGTTTTVPSSDYVVKGPIYHNTSAPLSVTYNNQTATFTLPNVEEKFTLDNANLPSDYTQLSYVQASGQSGCYVYLSSDQGNIAAKPSTVSYAKYGMQAIERLTSASKRHIMSSKSTVFPSLITGSSGTAQVNSAYHTTSIAGIPYEWQANTNYVLEGLPDIYVNGECIGSAGIGTDTNDQVFTLFAYNDGSNPGNTNFTGKFRLYFMRIYGNDKQLLMNLVPCKNSSNVVGLYDTVNNIFLHAVSSGQLYAPSNS